MKRYIIPLWLKAGFIFFFILSACSKNDDDGYSGGNNNGGGNTSNSVSIGSSSFSPASITIKTGSTVTWTNNDAALHTVTADDGSFNSGNLAYYQAFTRTFNQAGTFKYHCTHHSNMNGTVVVNQ